MAVLVEGAVLALVAKILRGNLVVIWLVLASVVFAVILMMNYSIWTATVVLVLAVKVVVVWLPLAVRVVHNQFCVAQRATADDRMKWSHRSTPRGHFLWSHLPARKSHTGAPRSLPLSPVSDRWTHRLLLR